MKKGRSLDGLRRKRADALITFDETAHLEKLIELARSELPPSVAGDWLAELCPTATSAELDLLYATFEYDNRGRKPPESKKAAIARLAKKYGCDERSLKRCVNGAGNGHLIAYRKNLP